MTTIAVDTTSTVGTVNPLLAGAGNMVGNSGETAYDSTAFAVISPYVNLLRVGGKLAQATGIATSASGSITTPGRAGSPYFYDWTAVDTLLTYATSFAGGANSIYLMSGGCPQILGGSQAPLTGTARTTTPIEALQWVSTMPSSNSSWAQIVGDLLDHIVNAKGITPAFWSAWNEPDAGSWGGTQAQLFAMYAAVAPVVRSVSPTTKIVGPTISGWNDSWMQAFINYCATNSLPLDAIDWHDYTGDISAFNRARLLTDRYLASAGLATGLPIMITEHASVNNACFYGTGQAPWSSLEYGINDWSAAFLAATLMEGQRCNAACFARYAPHSEEGWTDYFSQGLTADSAMWSNGNVYRMWSMLQPTTIKTTVLGGDGGLFCQASRNTAGTHHTILLSNLHFHQAAIPGTSEYVTVRVPGISGTVTQYQIDDATSNQYQAGSANAALQTVAAPAIDSSGRIRLSMKPRSVVLLDVQ